MGDILFAVNLARFLKIDPELALKNPARNSLVLSRNGTMARDGLSLR
jgi:uncharacterized protein YabN with tetrapyrrole methylase and pyrophosphatase domain